jgi:hypothetical protein
MDNETLKELKQDAMRYRWLRSTQNQELRWTETRGCIDSIMVSEGNDCASAPDPHELDYYVDVQMEKYPLIYWGREAAQDVFGNVAIQGACQCDIS